MDSDTNDRIRSDTAIESGFALDFHTSTLGKDMGVDPEVVAAAATHAARGAGASLVALLALANALGNRRSLVRALRALDASGLRLFGPSRSIAAVAVFVGGTAVELTSLLLLLLQRDD